MTRRRAAANNQAFLLPAGHDIRPMLNPRQKLGLVTIFSKPQNDNAVVAAGIMLALTDESILLFLYCVDFLYKLHAFCRKNYTTLV